MQALLLSLLASFLTGGSDTKQSAPPEPQATAADTGSHVNNLISTFGNNSLELRWCNSCNIFELCT